MTSDSRRVRISVCLQGIDAPVDFERNVGEIDRLGYDGLWLTDSSLHTRNCWSYLALAARAAPRLTLGTAVTNPLSRHPAITAASAATTAEISDGRFALGIGVGDRPLLALGHKPARLADLETSIDAIRQLLAGEQVTTRAGSFRLDRARYRFAPDHAIPIWISASGPKTLALAGRIADGVILLAGLHPNGLRFALEHIDRGVEQAGRDSRPEITVFAYGAIDDDDPEAAHAAARTIAAWFPQTAPMHCELAGLSAELVAQVRGSYRGGEFQEAARAAEALPAEFVDRMALAGGSAQARRHIRAVMELGIDGITVFPLGGKRMDTVRRFRACVAEELAHPGDGANRTAAEAAGR